VSTVLGTFDEYLAATGQGLNPGAHGATYNNNPIWQPVGQNTQTFIPPTIGQDGEVTGRFRIWDSLDCQTCGQQCDALIHDATTGYWYVFFATDCAGFFAIGQPPQPECGNLPQCDPCWQKTSFAEGANQALQEDFSGNVVIANLFPAWSYSIFGFSGREPVVIDAVAVACSAPYIENWITLSIPRLGARGCPPGTTFNPQTETCDQPAGRSRVGFVDPPLPLASDGNGFAQPVGPFALPVHPTISAQRIRETCGVCGEDGQDGEELEI
jgi:hypothetical protein